MVSPTTLAYLKKVLEVVTVLSNEMSSFAATPHVQTFSLRRHLMKKVL